VDSQKIYSTLLKRERSALIKGAGQKVSNEGKKIKSLSEKEKKKKKRGTSWECICKSV
jgi:hypothetical protein